MAELIKRYVEPFFPPIKSIEMKSELNDTFYEKQIEYKISKWGFPAKEILKIIKADEGASQITGSFLLNFLTDPDDWDANDIDVFTSNENLHNLIEPHMSKFTKERFGIQVLSNPAVRDTSYEMGLERTILGIYEWQSPVNSTKKFQIILVDKDPIDVIDNFDFNIVKSRFDGYELSIPTTTFDTLLMKTDKVFSAFKQCDTLRRTLERRTKYEKRGYKVLLPQYISVETRMNVYRHGMTYYPVIDKYYIATDSYILTLKDEYIGESYDPSMHTNYHTLTSWK